jgi:hypothetical protein
MQVDHIEIAKLELRRGDVLLVRVPPDWTLEQQHAAHDAVKEAMECAGANAPIIIGTTDIEIQVIRKNTGSRPLQSVKQSNAWST